MAYAQVEVNMSRYQHDKLTKSSEVDTEAKKSSGKTLMIFNDKSWSMNGTPFEALKKACKGVAEMIYNKQGSTVQSKNDHITTLFDNVYLLFYDNTLNSMKIKGRLDYLTKIKNESIGNQTNFKICFDRITDQVDAMSKGEECFIMFLTDG